MAVGARICSKRILKMLGEWRNGSEVLGFEAQPFVGSYAAGHDYTEGHSEFKILCGRNVYDWTNRDSTDETVKTMVVEPLALSKRVEVARTPNYAFFWLQSDTKGRLSHLYTVKLLVKTCLMEHNYPMRLCRWKSMPLWRYHFVCVRYVDEWCSHWQDFRYRLLAGSHSSTTHTGSRAKSDVLDGGEVPHRKEPDSGQKSEVLDGGEVPRSQEPDNHTKSEALDGGMEPYNVGREWDIKMTGATGDPDKLVGVCSEVHWTDSCVPCWTETR